MEFYWKFSYLYNQRKIGRKISRNFFFDFLNYFRNFKKIWKFSKNEKIYQKNPKRNFFKFWKKFRKFSIFKINFYTLIQVTINPFCPFLIKPKFRKKDRKPTRNHLSIRDPKNRKFKFFAKKSSKSNQPKYQKFTHRTNPKKTLKFQLVEPNPRPQKRHKFSWKNLLKKSTNFDHFGRNESNRKINFWNFFTRRNSL